MTAEATTVDQHNPSAIDYDNDTEIALMVLEGTRAPNGCMYSRDEREKNRKFYDALLATGKLNHGDYVLVDSGRHWTAHTPCQLYNALPIIVSPNAFETRVGHEKSAALPRQLA